MNKPKETPIFPMDIPPVRKGIYKIHLKQLTDETRFALWKNGQWHSWQETAAFASKAKIRSTLCYDSYYTKGWSGLAEPPHD